MNLISFGICWLICCLKYMLPLAYKSILSSEPVFPWQSPSLFALSSHAGISIFLEGSLSPRCPRRTALRPAEATRASAPAACRSGNTTSQNPHTWIVGDLDSDTPPLRPGIPLGMNGWGVACGPNPHWNFSMSRGLYFCGIREEGNLLLE